MHERAADGPCLAEGGGEAPHPRPQVRRLSCTRTRPPLTACSFNSFHILRNIEGTSCDPKRMLCLYCLLRPSLSRSAHHPTRPGILDAPALRHLSLSGSPVSKMPNYRAYVVAKVSTLQARLRPVVSPLSSGRSS